MKIGGIGYGNIPLSGYIYGGYAAGASAIGATEEADKAEEASAALFGGGADSANIPQAVISDDKFTDGTIDIMGVLVAAGMVTSRSEARRAVEQGGVSVNDEKITDISASYTKDQIGSGDFLVRRGKKSFKKIVVE